MDQFVIELGPGRHGVRIGDPVRLFGPGDGGEPTAQQCADLTGTIPYEILTLVRGRAGRLVEAQPTEDRP